MAETSVTEDLMAGLSPDMVQFCRIVKETMLSKGLIQLITECDATLCLLRDVAHVDGADPTALFAHLDPHATYDYARAVTWMAFSYTCQYTQALINLPETLAAEYKDIMGPVQQLVTSRLNDPQTYADLKLTTLKKVAAERSGELVNFIEHPEVLFHGADTPVKDICKAKVPIGTARPLKQISSAQAAELRSLLTGGTFARESEDLWRAGLGTEYRLMRIDIADLGLMRGSVKVVEVEIVLQQESGRKGARAGRIRCADRTTWRETSLESGAPDASPAFMAKIMSLRPGFAGDKVEYDTAKIPLALAGDAHWQAKETDWRLGTGGNRALYYGRIHPKITQYAVQLLSAQDSLTILDVAGGNGDLAERMIKELTKDHMFGDLKINYILLDYSETDVTVANRRFAALKKTCPHANPIACVRNMFTYDFDAEKLRKDLNLPSGVDLVINSGGLLNTQIGDDRTAPEKFSAMYRDVMAPGGYGIYSGLTPLLVNADTHRRHNLRIHNLYDAEFNIQMHVVQRPK